LEFGVLGWERLERFRVEEIGEDVNGKSGRVKK